MTENLAITITMAKHRGQEPTCPFCRFEGFLAGRELFDRTEQRMTKGDPQAFTYMAGAYQVGEFGLPTDDGKAFELHRRAVDLGSAESCIDLAQFYERGIVVSRDIAKSMYYLKLGAKRGSIRARCWLGSFEAKYFNPKAAVKHWVLCASAGDDRSLKLLKEAYNKKHATKVQFEVALRAHRKAKKDMSSFERDMHAKFEKGGHEKSALTVNEWRELCGIRKEKK